VPTGRRAAEASTRTTTRLRGYKKVALANLPRLHGTMGKLAPQIRCWLRTRFVAANKIISLQIPELYAIVRGKVGKTVERGLNWGIKRCAGDSSWRRWRRRRLSSSCAALRRRRARSRPRRWPAPRLSPPPIRRRRSSTPPRSSPRRAPIRRAQGPCGLAPG